MNHDLTTRAGQISHYAEVRARIRAARYVPTKIHIVQNRWPEWKRKSTHFDWHVLSFKVESKTSPHIKWLKTRCRELGVLYSDIRGRRGSDELCLIRMRLYWEMKNLFTNLSFPELGAAFGGRDHTTILHGIKKWEVLRHENDQ